MSKLYNNYMEWETPEHLKQVEQWAAKGLIDEQIAHNIGISRRTLSSWKRQHEELKEALQAGKAVADYEVENALYKKAVGGVYTETVTGIDKETGKEYVIKKTKKEIAGDVTACIFWLKNRQPEKWSDSGQSSYSVEEDNDMILQFIDHLKNPEN